MVKTILLIITFGVFYAWAENSEHSEHKEQHKSSKLITGEVMDLTCYISHPKNGQGKDHAKCAKKCINKGLPVGLLSEGTLYLISGDNHKSANEMMAEYAGQIVTVEGKVKEENGMKLLLAKKIVKK